MYSRLSGDWSRVSFVLKDETPEGGVKDPCRWGIDTHPPPFPVLAIALDVGKGVLVQVIARASERVLA